MQYKWIEYATGVLKSVHRGAASIKQITEDLKGSETYIAKVIAELRKAGLIDCNYDLKKRPEDITMRELLEAAKLNKPVEPVAARVYDLVLVALEIPITNVW